MYPFWGSIPGTAVCASPGGDSPVRLSRRELEVAGLVAHGLTNREIAQRLFISERTIDGHLEHVREKLGVNTRAQVATWVVRHEALEITAAPSESISRPAPRQNLIAHPRLWVATALLLAMLAAGVGVMRLTAPPAPLIQTIAGITSADSFPGGGYRGDNDFAINAELSWPSDLAVGPDGAIYIADFGNRVVRKISNQIITTVAGGGSNAPYGGAVATQVSIGYASSLAVDSRGDLYVLTDLAGDLEVWMIAPDSLMTLVVSLGHSSSRYMQPHWNPPVGGLAVATDGTLYIADRAENKVWTLAPGAKTMTLFAGTGQAGSSGDLGPATSAQLEWPIGLALGQHGDLYIADTQNNRIRRVDGLRGTITTVTPKANLSVPFGLAFRSDGTLFIADSGHNQILEMLPSGDILAVAGTGADGYLGDGGPASEAKLSGPNAIALDRTGRLLVADSGNHRVRVVTGL
jgi:DNA-binding CsgD family transcriptional regulator/sugar lactone lactonase YvrE